MTDLESFEYYLWREREERSMAIDSASRAAFEIHSELAGRYSELVRRYWAETPRLALVRKPASSSAGGAGGNRGRLSV